MTRFRSKTLIALGGNLPSDAGDPAQSLLAAIENMAAEGLRVCAISRFFRTPSFPDRTAPDYVNAAACVLSDLSPVAMLAVLHRIEHRFGRIREQRWGMRTLDLDMLAIGQTILPDRPTFEAWLGLPTSRQIRAVPDQLIVPHPRLQDRAFVLVPMADIAPEWTHPVLNLSVPDLCARLPRADVAAVRPI